jgi:hypothetical protein
MPRASCFIVDLLGRSWRPRRGAIAWLSVNGRHAPPSGERAIVGRARFASMSMAGEFVSGV